LDVVLHEEVPVVRTQVRPYEEVTLTVEVLAGEQEVTVVLREQQIAAEARGAALPAYADTHEPVWCRPRPRPNTQPVPSI